MTMLVLVFALVALGLLVVLGLAYFIKTHGAVRLLLRFAFGLHLDGKPRTDAGWLRHGVRVMHPTGHASKWAHLPHLHRAGIRWAVVVAIVAVCAGLASNLRLTAWALAAVATALLAWCVTMAVRQLRRRKHVRRYVRPLHHALAPAIGVPLAARPQSWLTVPRRFDEIEGAQIRVDLPEKFLGTPDAKRIVQTALAEKLGIDDGNVEFHTVGIPYATITRSSPPPDKVTFSAVQSILEAAPESSPIIGIGRKNATVSADFDADSPHALVSAGSGGGKSTIVRCLLCQELHKGALAVVCDIKRISHAWARGLPNVRYCRSIAEIHDTLILVKAEVDRRNELVDALADDDGNVPAEAMAQMGPRLILAMEEMNATANRLAAYWRKTKAKEDPTVSPAVEALGDILFMGRAVRVNVIAVAQMMTARTLGGPEARENFATRILARYTLNAWKMLVPEVWPMPRMSRHQGRVQVVIGGQARETQVLYSTPSEAREWSMSGAVSRFASVAAGGALTGSQAATVQGTEPVRLTGPDVHLVGEVEPVGLREAIDAGALAVTLDTARWARANDPEFPPARGKRGQELLYAPADLIAWQANRARAGESSDDQEAAGQ
jgi:hypothetical protein